jgi:cell filamentation protein, protein adenylyltransferase
MFPPQIQFTQSIADSLSRIEEMRRLINTLAVLPHWELSIRREALVNTVHSTTAIEGNRLSREQVERIVDGGRPAADARDAVEVRNVIALMKELYGLAKEEVPVDERLIREMNRRVLDDVPGSLNPGEYRRGQNYVQDSLTGGVVFTPPDQGDVPSLMASLSDWLKLEQTGLSPILKAGVAHLELVAIHPFWDGNGRVGRALATYVMYATGYDFRRFHSWETYLNADIRSYTNALAASLGDDYYHTPRNYTPWLEYFTQALAVTLDDLRREIEALRHAWDAAFAAASRLGLDHTQVQALMHAAFYGSVSTDAYREATGISRATAFRHLRELEGSGLIARVGRGRATHYVPAQALLAPVREPIA